MGYRSDIYIKVRTDKYPPLAKILQEHDFKDCIDHFSIEDGVVTIIMQDLKWYDSYKDVSAVNDYIRSLEEAEGCLLRNGEDGLDIEEINNGSELDLYYHTETIVDGDFGTPIDVKGIPTTETHPELFI